MRQLSYILIITLLTGCIEEYNQKGIKADFLLVIDGKITNNESTFNLSRTIGLSEWTTTSKVEVNDALIYVEKSDGELMQGVNKGHGIYVIQTGTLEEDFKYRLLVKLGMEEYRSEFLSPLFTPEIDSLAPYKRNSGEPIYMCLYTHDPKDQSKYYIWSYKEIWETQAPLFANYGFLTSDVGQYFSLDNDQNTYHCWVRDSSKTFILGSSENLSENIIYQKRLNEFPCDNDRLSMLYFITVEQNQIRKEAYDYYSNLQKNINQAGDIFSPTPVEIKGNIYCVTNTNIPIIGFVDVTTTTKKELFIPRNTDLYEEVLQGCSNSITDDPRDQGRYPLPFPPEHPYLNYYIVPDPFNKYEALFAFPRCVDCRTREGATKNRPDFWPNDHY